MRNDEKKAKSALLYLPFMLLVQIPIGLWWWWKWNTMTTAWCWTMYCTIGFILATAQWCFFSPPWRTKFSGSMALFASMTPEEAAEEDEVFALWLMYFCFLLVWPIMLVVVDVYVFFATVVFASKSIAFIFWDNAEVEE